MNFSAWAIKNPVAPLLAFFMLMVLGWQSFNALPVTRFPNIDVPLVAITVGQSGASPAELESQVTKEVEDAVASITGVDEINSTVTDGQSQTVVMFRMEVPTEQAVQDVKDAIDQIRGDLPADLKDPQIARLNLSGQLLGDIGGDAEEARECLDADQRPGPQVDLGLEVRNDFARVQGGLEVGRGRRP